MPLPILTWSQTAYTTTGFVTPTDAQVIQAINTATATLTSWRKISVDSATWTYIELGGPIGSPTENFRILIGGAPGASAVLAPDTTANAIWVGIAPDGGTLGTWNSATPYSAARWTKYWKCCTTAVAESLYFVESNECLALIFRDDSLDNFYGFITGAIINPGVGDAEASGNVYGIVTTGATTMSATFWTSLAAFPSHGASNSNPHAGVFRPTQPATFEAMFRIGTFTLDTTASLTFNSGLETALPTFYCSAQTPRYFVGSLRQILMSIDRSTRTSLPGVGITLSSTTSPTTSDSMLFSNA